MEEPWELPSLTRCRVREPMADVFRRVFADFPEAAPALHVVNQDGHRFTI